MAIKTFNIDAGVYAQFASFCRSYGVSMSKQVEMFMASQITEEPKVRAEYLRKLENIRKGKFVAVKSFSERYGL